MSTGWSLFIIAGTLLTLAWALWLLLSNRTKATATVETTGHEFDGIEEYDNPLPLWWVGLFVATILFAVGYLVYYPGLGSFPGLGGWTSQQQWQRDVAAKDAQFAPLYQSLAALSEADLHASRQASQIGRRLYLNHCSTCHGMAARGAFGFPNLTDGEWQWGGDFEAVKTTLRGGRMAAMAPWGAALGGDEGVKEMVDYVLSLSGAEHDAAAAARAAPKFQMFCAVCHTPEGTGNVLFGAPDLTNDIWLYGGDRASITFTLTHGRNGHMPAFADVLGEERIHILAAYVTGLGRP
jgi:cytochrome c oxidase cbb3-type subunit 3